MVRRRYDWLATSRRYDSTIEIDHQTYYAQDLADRIARRILTVPHSGRKMTNADMRRIMKVARRRRQIPRANGAQEAAQSSSHLLVSSGLVAQPSSHTSSRESFEKATQARARGNQEATSRRREDYRASLSYARRRRAMPRASRRDTSPMYSSSEDDNIDQVAAHVEPRIKRRRHAQAARELQKRKVTAIKALNKAGLPSELVRGVVHNAGLNPPRNPYKGYAPQYGDKYV